MPAKPRHKRGKLSPQARRRRETTRGPATVAATTPQGQTALAQAPAAQPAAGRPSARPAKGMALASSAMQTIAHQQVGTELRTIGIITAILVALLVVLSFVIH